MADIIKTWPACVSPRATAKLFSQDDPPYCEFYFTLGRGMPKQKIERLWFTYLGRILGCFTVDRIVVNDGTLPKLSRIDGGESEWRIKKDAKVAICLPPCTRLTERLFMDGFRGWRYFDFEAWRSNPESRVRL